MFALNVEKIFMIIIINVCICNVVVANYEDSRPVVDTRLGKVLGAVMISVHDKPFHAFRGIPYAKPPIKELRFRPPVPIERWDNIFDATEDGHRCVQHDLLRGIMTGDEDCLLLNVYSPQLPSSILRPVMVFIHGGGFSWGDGRSDMYGPERLIDKEIVLVTINYRLSALGFMSTLDAASPGNYGLLDQVEALKWVRDNIVSFGGDPNSVTIFGESAGSASVVFHLLSPISKGLFHAAIPQSGSSVSEWAVQTKSTMARQTRQLAKKLNCPTENSEALVRCMRRKSALDIATKSYRYEQIYRGDKSPPMEFMGIVDKGFGDVEFLPDHPRQLMEAGQINKVPVMMGICKDEGFFFLQMFSASRGGIDNIRNEDVVNDFCNEPVIQVVKSDFTIEQIVAEYTSEIDATNKRKRIVAFANLMGDSIMNKPIDDTINGLAMNGVPTYSYIFNQKGPHSISDFLAINETDIKYKDEMGVVTHCDDLQYIFKLKIFDKRELNEEETKMADIMVTLWTNFAKNKVPSFDGSNIDQDAVIDWKPFQPNRPSYVELGLKPTIKEGVFCSRPELWKPKIKDEL